MALCEKLDVEPPGPSDGTGASACDEPDPAEEPTAKTTYRRSWAALLKRVFQNDVLVCPSCGSDRKIIGTITKREAIVQILDHLGLASDDVAIAPARAPPQTELWDELPT